MQTMRIRNAVLAAAAVAAMSGCATVQTPTKGDPFEGFNRTMYKFNDTVDTYALKPVAQGYAWAVPQPVRDSVTNFFSNIGDAYIAANNIAQLKIADGVGDIMRVVINTVFGVGGLFDVATLAKLPKHTADFGLTMGHYGVPSGPYLVLPLLGPSTVRDTAGLAVDYVGNPLTYVKPDGVSWGLFGVNLVNTRANLLGAGDVLNAAAIDKYSFVRNAYLQRRQGLISGSTADSLPDYSGEALPKYDMPDTGAAAPASGAAAEAPNPGSSTSVPAQQFVPPSPGGLHLPNIRLP
ncbi:MlaA family lipoprotein [Burkholderia alba]|uniref:MlaA family lipoprotein n=1 Tax=Burkholderia alba TaxID=2683677 RepID=UPI002B05CC61|nr:VacJ family lipoprotein [Burkholderia alba]